jgi:hypothetical protein
MAPGYGETVPSPHSWPVGLPVAPGCCAAPHPCVGWCGDVLLSAWRSWRHTAAVREPERRESWRCNSNPVHPVHPVNPVGKTSERMASHCTVHEPGLRDRGFALRGSRTGATGSWLCIARFTNRNDGIMAVQCPIRSILSILSKNVRTHGVTMHGSRTGTTESWRCNAQSGQSCHSCPKTSERMASHCAVHEPGYGNRGVALAGS